MIPISPVQDSVGPITRCVEDCAIVLSVIAGKDADDEATLAQPAAVPDYTRALNPGALVGKRIGVPRRVYLDESITGADPSVGVAFSAALDVLRGLGAVVVDPADLPSADDINANKNEKTILEVDGKVRTVPANASTRFVQC